MDRTLGEWGRKGRGHWVNGVGEATPDGVGKSRIVEWHWVDGAEEKK